MPPPRPARRDGLPRHPGHHNGPTLVDLSDDLTVEQLANVIHEAAFRNRFNLDATRAAMSRANGRRNLGVLERAIELHLGGSAGTRSDAEDAFLSMIRQAGAPEPVTNTPIEVDFHWPERKLVVEVDGPGHRRPRTVLDDKNRDQRLADAGWRVVRVRP